MPRLRRLVNTIALALLALAGLGVWGLIAYHVGVMNLLLLTALATLGLNVGSLGNQVERLERQVRRLRDDRLNDACAGVVAHEIEVYDHQLDERDSLDALDDLLERQGSILTGRQRPTDTERRHAVTAMSASSHGNRTAKSAALPRGVYRTTNGGRYAARVVHGKTLYHLGTYATPEEAAEAVRAKRSTLPDGPRRSAADSPLEACVAPDCRDRMGGGPHKPGLRPWRLNAKKFGIDGVICTDCYSALYREARRQERGEPRVVAPCAECGSVGEGEGEARTRHGFRRYQGQTYGVDGVLCLGCWTEAAYFAGLTPAVIAERAEAVLVRRFGPRVDPQAIDYHAPEGYEHDDREPLWESLEPAEACRRLIERFDGTAAWDVFGPLAVVRAGGTLAASEREDAA